MKVTRFASMLALPLVVGLASTSTARVTGRGNKKADCYTVFDGITASGKFQGKEQVICKDGDPDCDQDGQENGTCQIGFRVCAFQTDATLPACTPQPITLFKGAKPAGLKLPAPGAAAACATEASIVPVPLKKGGKKPGRVRVSVTAVSTGKPKADKNVFFLRCEKGGGGVSSSCVANAAGGPRSLSFKVPSPADPTSNDPAQFANSTDLDNGWKGPSHSFPVTPNSTVTFCLSECDGVTDAPCKAEGKVGAGTTNGTTFGAPLPLITSDTPVCVINNFRENITGGTANPVTGEINGTVKLLSDVYITDKTAVCPRCSGGKCDSGPNKDKACTVDGTLKVAQAVGGTLYPLSRDCLPQGPPAARLNIDLPLTTGTTGGVASGQCGPPAFDVGRCNVQLKDDLCSGAGCGAACTGTACVKKIPNPSNPAEMICVDQKGGLNQQCCNGKTDTSCQIYPLTRTGLKVPPAVGATPDTLTANETLAATFCIPATGACNVDSITGLPGPGALLLPVTTTWKK